MVEENNKRDDRPYIGDLFRKVIEKQKESVKEITYGVCEISDREACEMIAKKILEGQKVF